MARAQGLPPHRTAGCEVGPGFGPVQAYLFDLDVQAGAAALEQAEIEKQQREAEREFRRSRGFDL